MNEIHVTVTGIVGTDVVHATGGRSNRAKFRLATNERYLDQATNTWVDRETVWLDVVCWKTLADHVAVSVRNGDPVLVRGRLRVSTWESDSGPRQSLEVTATAIGHDLTKGRATFTRERASRQQALTVPATDARGDEPRGSEAAPPVRDVG